MEYRYILETGSRKYNCPRCNHKTFVRFIDTKEEEYLPFEFGRCDRETKCKYLMIPKYKNNSPIQTKFVPPQPPSFHNIDLVIESGRNFKKNNLIQFLKTIFTEKKVKNIIIKYAIGTSKHWDGATIFWQLDNHENIRHGKVMLYNIETGKRLKNKKGKAYISSIRSILKLKNFNLKQCLFGLHLINYEATKNIAIVESEKTAIIMSLFKPEYIWLATGSKQGFKYDILKPIKPFSIVAFPDKGEYNDWEVKAMELNEIGFDIKVSKCLENTDFKKGTDLADIYLEQKHQTSYSKSEIEKKIEEPKKKEILVKPIVSKTEAVIKSLAAINPNIYKLINTFDLTYEN